MPSTNQGARVSNADYDTEEKRMLATKNDATIKAIIRGIRRPDRARRFIEAEISLAESEDRSPRKKLIGTLNRKVTDLRAEEDGSAA